MGFIKCDFFCLILISLFIKFVKNIIKYVIINLKTVSNRKYLWIEAAK